MATILRFEDLEIWKEAVKIAVEIYKLTSRDKLEKDFSSKDQLRRAQSQSPIILQKDLNTTITRCSVNFSPMQKHRQES